jgi:hypothetical protein
MAVIDRRNQNLLALTTWAGALPFEAVRDGFEPWVSAYISAAVHDRVDDLTRLSRQNPPAQAGTFALVGATVVDGTGRASIDNATIVIRDKRIAAVGPSAKVTLPPSNGGPHHFRVLPRAELRQAGTSRTLAHFETTAASRGEPALLRQPASHECSLLRREAQPAPREVLEILRNPRGAHEPRTRV